MSQTGSLTQSVYEYNHQNRMVRSRVIDDEARTIASTRYGYDPLGRRTLVQDNNATTLRTLYDGLGFDVVKESPVYASGGFVDTYNTGIQYTSSGRATGERYRYLDDGVSATSEKYQYIEDNEYQTVSSRYAGERAMLYAHGAPVAVNRGSGSRGYLGTDIMGSTRSVTDSHGVQESYYDYDVFGSPVTGDFTTGVDYGYLGKSYDSRTGLYNYGYRDYSPQTVRFTTVDPIRDGTNWFAYVNNDPVNYVDLWGLSASDVTAYKIPIAEIGGTLVVGANVELAFVFDTANNRGIAISVDGGVGISANIDLPIPAILNVILNRTINSATNLETISGTIQDFEGTYATTSVHAIGGVEMDLNNPQAAEFSIALSLGGGVYWGYTKVIEFIDGDGKK